MKKSILLILLTVWSIQSATGSQIQGMERPNIIFILADDMGYGDVSCLNPDAKFKTPNLMRWRRAD